MRGFQKLCRNGSSTVVTIPRPILYALDWLPGQVVIIEVLEDKSIRVRVPEQADFRPKPIPRLMFGDATKGAP